MRRQQTNPINTTTTTTTTTSDNLATELRQIQNMSRDNFVGREQPTVHHKRNDENNNNKIPNTETVDPTSTIPPDRPSNQYMTEEQIRDMVNYYYSRNPTSTRPRMNIATMHTQPLTPPPTSPVQDPVPAATNRQHMPSLYSPSHSIMIPVRTKENTPLKLRIILSRTVNTRLTRKALRAYDARCRLSLCYLAPSYFAIPVILLYLALRTRCRRIHIHPRHGIQ